MSQTNDPPREPQHGKGSLNEDKSSRLLPVPFNRLMLIPPIAVMILAIIEIQFYAVTWNILYDKILYKTVWDDIFRLTKHLDALDHFPEVVPIVAVIIATWVYQPRYRATILPFILSIGLASAITGGVKELTGRARPALSIRMDEDKRHQEMWKYMEAHPDAGLKMEAGDYWLGLQWDRPWFQGDFASFPSGHATTAFVFAFWLGLLYGRLKWLWYLMAVGTCLARVRFRRHFPGDVMMGGALGWMVAYLIFSHPASARLGAWGERKAIQVWERLRRGARGTDGGDHPSSVSERA